MKDLFVTGAISAFGLAAAIAATIMMPTVAEALAILT